MDTLIGGRYQIINNLGKGGFGETFLARDTHLPSQKLIVIKRLHQIASEQKVSFEIVTRLFKKEAEVLEDLGQHCTQIPSLYAYFVENEQFYLVQEYVQGQSLADLGIISPLECRRILTSLLKTLRYIHSKKIIHRDLKPENIIIRSSDRDPVLIDFGAVKEAMGTIILHSQAMASSVVVGTQGFMPPEQGTGRTVYSSDLFSLGLTMIYCLTGKYPLELKNNSLTGELEWQNYVPNLDPSLQAVLEKSTKIDLSQRYLTAEEMLQDLNMSAVNTMAVIPPRRNISASPQQIHQQSSAQLGGTKVAQRATLSPKETAAANVNYPRTNHIPTLLKSNDNEKSPPYWVLILFVILLMILGGTAGFALYQFLNNTQEQLANSEQQRTQMQAQLEEEQQRRLEEENRRAELEKLRREAELERIKKQKEEERKRLEKQREEQQKLIEEQREQELENNNNTSENEPIKPQTPSFQVPDAIATIESFYNLVSQKQYSQAQNYFTDPNLFNAKFFDQFTQVTVSNLQVTEQSDDSFTLIGTNVYYYNDGTTQTEKRNYTVQAVDDQLKIVESNFIRVIKLRQ